jgi:hypothetical protein
MFAQEVVAIDTREKHCSSVGEVRKCAIVTPDIDYLLDSTHLSTKERIPPARIIVRLFARFYSPVHERTNSSSKDNSSAGGGLQAGCIRVPAKLIY